MKKNKTSKIKKLSTGGGVGGTADSSNTGALIGGTAASGKEGVLSEGTAGSADEGVGTGGTLASSALKNGGTTKGFNYSIGGL